MPRCCQPIADEFRPCYASVLAFGPDGLRAAVERCEQQAVTPCFTAWCARCWRNYLLAPDVQAFAYPSAHHTHKLVLLEHLRAQGLLLAPQQGDQP